MCRDGCKCITVVALITFWRPLQTGNHTASAGDFITQQAQNATQAFDQYQANRTAEVPTAQAFLEQVGGDAPCCREDK